jgi:hypothetical protein
MAELHFHYTLLKSLEAAPHPLGSHPQNKTEERKIRSQYFTFQVSKSCFRSQKRMTVMGPPASRTSRNPTKTPKNWNKPPLSVQGHHKKTNAMYCFQCPLCTELLVWGDEMHWKIRSQAHCIMQRKAPGRRHLSIQKLLSLKVPVWTMIIRKTMWRSLEYHKKFAANLFKRG